MEDPRKQITAFLADPKQNRFVNITPEQVAGMVQRPLDNIPDDCIPFDIMKDVQNLSALFSADTQFDDWFARLPTEPDKRELAWQSQMSSDAGDNKVSFTGIDAAITKISVKVVNFLLDGEGNPQSWLLEAIGRERYEFALQLLQVRESRSWAELQRLIAVGLVNSFVLQFAEIASRPLMKVQQTSVGDEQKKRELQAYYLGRAVDTFAGNPLNRRVTQQDAAADVQNLVERLQRYKLVVPEAAKQVGCYIYEQAKAACNKHQLPEEAAIPVVLASIVPLLKPQLKITGPFDKHHKNLIDNVLNKKVAGLKASSFVSFEGQEPRSEIIKVIPDIKQPPRPTRQSIAQHTNPNESKSGIAAWLNKGLLSLVAVATTVVNTAMGVVNYFVGNVFSFFIFVKTKKSVSQSLSVNAASNTDSDTESTGTQDSKGANGVSGSTTPTTPQSFSDDENEDSQGQSAQTHLDDTNAAGHPMPGTSPGTIVRSLGADRVSGSVPTPQPLSPNSPRSEGSNGVAPASPQPSPPNSRRASVSDAECAGEAAAVPGASLAGDGSSLLVPSCS